MIFGELCDTIFALCKNKNDTKLHSEELEAEIFSLSKTELIPLVSNAGIIPESIAHDSSEEKLFTKATEIILAKCFQELGLKAETIKTRSGCADVSAKSRFHNYSLVADAKAFRLSRTAKNQKDFKVEAMDSWRKEADYAVLACPYFQYPKKASQIYEQAITRNVLLFSWEYIRFLLENDIAENEKIDLSFVWNQSAFIAHSITADKIQNRFLEAQDKNIVLQLGLEYRNFLSALKKDKEEIICRSEKEIAYWQKKRNEIQSYTREKAVSELISSLKINEKISAIESFSVSLMEEDLEKNNDE